MERDAAFDFAFSFGSVFDFAPAFVFDFAFPFLLQEQCHQQVLSNLTKHID